MRKWNEDIWRSSLLYTGESDCNCNAVKLPDRPYFGGPIHKWCTKKIHDKWDFYCCAVRLMVVAVVTHCSRALWAHFKSLDFSHHSNVFVSYIEDTVFTCVCFGGVCAKKKDILLFVGKRLQRNVWNELTCAPHTCRVVLNCFGLLVSKVTGERRRVTLEFKNLSKQRCY